MNKFDSFKKWTKRNAPTLLFAAGCASFVSTIIFTAKEAPEAKERLDELKESEEYKELSKPKKVLAVCKTAGPAYAGTIISGATCITCFATSFGVNQKRNASWAAGYAILDKKFRDYRDENLKLIGPKKEAIVREEVAKKEISENPPTDSNTFMADGKGNQLYMDGATGRYFWSDQDTISEAIVRLERRKKYEDWISLNEFYYEIGISGIGLGDVNGWNADMDIDISRSTCILAPNGCSCIVLEYDTCPRERY